MACHNRNLPEYKVLMGIYNNNLVVDSIIDEYQVKENTDTFPSIAEAEDIVKGVTSYMNSESYYDSHWNEFIKYTRQLDSIRDENLLDVEPQFKEYING